jgi:hypothetical protein
MVVVVNMGVGGRSFCKVRGVKLLELRKHNLSGSSTEYPYELRDSICPQLV